MSAHSYLCPDDCTHKDHWRGMSGRAKQLYLSVYPQEDQPEEIRGGYDYWECIAGYARSSETYTQLMSRLLRGALSENRKLPHACRLDSGSRDGGVYVPKTRQELSGCPSLLRMRDSYPARGSSCWEVTFKEGVRDKPKRVYFHKEPRCPLFGENSIEDPYR
jgi:hypothetical protein